MEYFGELLSEQCSGCDNCDRNSASDASASQADLVDFTPFFRLFASAVEDAGYTYGMTMYVDIVKGSKASKVKDRFGDRLFSMPS